MFLLYLRQRLFIILCLTISFGVEGQGPMDSLLHSLKSIREDSILLRTYDSITKSFYQRKEDEQAQFFAEKLLQASNKLNAPNWAANAHWYLAKLNYLKGEVQPSISHWGSYVEFQKRMGNQLKVADGHFQLGKCYKSIGDFDKGLSHFIESVKIFKNLKNYEGLAQTYNSMAGIYKNNGHQEEAISYYKNAIALFKKGRNYKMYAMGLQNLGNLEGRNKEYKAAISYYEPALHIIDSLSLTYEKGIILGNIAGAYTGLQDHETALKYALKAFNLKKKSTNKRSFAYALTILGTSYLNVGRNMLALQKLDSAFLLAKEVGSKDLITEILELKAETNKSRGAYELAYDNLQDANLWRDSVYNENSARQISELRIAYESAQKDQEITLLNSENEVKEAQAKKQASLKNGLIIAIVLLSIIAALILNTLRARLKSQKLLTAKNEEVKMAKMEQQLGKLEMKALRAQMNPHFLFNCMNSINRMIMEEENDKASRYLSKFSKLVRQILENSENSKVSLKDELDMLRAYIDLESIRFKNKIEYQISVSHTIDQESTFIPPMVLQPFVENAIWHGLLHKKDKGLLTISIDEGGDKLNCSIIDNGIGRERSLKMKKYGKLTKTSMGIKITTDRLKLLTQKKIKGAVEIIDLKDGERALGTQVNLEIPTS